jgi:16S rRNA (guanine(966)-N(2))-methyltransferase RsmD
VLHDYNSRRLGWSNLNRPCKANTTHVNFVPELSLSLRIIGGQWRSRILARPDTPATRPMPDRVKQSIFNILGCYYECPGELPPIRVADVFAGSGSMGLEALSRGAAHCTFYEASRVAFQALRENVVNLDAGVLATVVTEDAWKSAGRDGSAFDLVFLDPPYKDTRNADSEGLVGSFLRRIAEKESLRNKTPLVVLHHFAKVQFSAMKLEEPWEIWDERRIGSNAVTFFKRKDSWAVNS